jgi:hypothetical protein
MFGKNPKYFGFFLKDSIFMTFRRNPKNIKVFSKGGIFTMFRSDLKYFGASYNCT